jgi:regulator of replication initiation timing
MSDKGSNDLEYKIEYLTNQNEYLKKSNKKLIDKNKILNEEFDRLLEENTNLRLVRKASVKYYDVFF